jgi:hypothetical protein
MRVLSPRQRAAVRLLADPAVAVKTIGHAAAAVGVSSRTLLRWRSSAEFNRAVAEEAAKYIDPRLGEVYCAMTERAIGGDVGAARLLCEIRGVIGGRAAASVAVARAEAPHEVVLSWVRVEGRSEEDEDLPRRDPEDVLLEAVALEERQRTGGQVIDAAEDSARRADELRRRAELEEARAARARREREEAEQAERERRLKAEIDARTKSIRAGEAYETRPIEDW